jgi:hypothetical protein
MSVEFQTLVRFVQTLEGEMEEDSWCIFSHTWELLFGIN